MHSVARATKQYPCQKTQIYEPAQCSFAVQLGCYNTPIRHRKISLVQKDCSFWNELEEFKSSGLQGTHQPMESRKVCINRAYANDMFPANFALLPASNSCPYKFYSVNEIPCSSSVARVITYKSRIDGSHLSTAQHKCRWHAHLQRGFCNFKHWQLHFFHRIKGGINKGNQVCKKAARQN
ncbi:MAG: ATP-binding protein [Eggerthellaceae bacterium]|nr:ATP-binding protein [Eggerthellaceae bacterium]